ncbi:MAG TPA: MFS transporter [Woeseiaceae bacterium]|nr:MFS transporter [Woeseiaceae bacterium]
MARLNTAKIPAGVFNRKVIAWALYDWANSAFALSVMAVLFPLFLGLYWSAGDTGGVVTQRLAWVTAAASAVVFVLAPVFGSIADAGGYRKRFLFVLALLGAAATAGLGLAPQSALHLALFLYLLASVGYYCSTVFYDSLLIEVVEPRYYNLVSSFGFAVGYLGGAALLALHVWMLSMPASFGFPDTNAVIKFAFVTVGAWWAIFMLPLLFFIPEGAQRSGARGNVIRDAYRELLHTLRNIGQYRNIVLFLTAYCLYIAAVFTVIFMAVNYGQRLGFEQKDLVMALMVTNFVGFPATILYGLFGHRYGSKLGLLVALAVYIAVSAWAVFMDAVWQFYVMAIIIGCVQGGVQSLSRSWYAALIPAQNSGEFFGFYNMLTKFAHVCGPALVGVAARISDSPKIVLLVLLPLLILGGLLLVRVPNESAV